MLLTKRACVSLQAGEGGGEGGLVGGLEERGAGHEGIGTGGAAFGGGGEIDPAIHFEAEGERAGAAPRVELDELGQQIATEGLAAEARLDGHDEDEIDVSEEGLDGGGGRAGVEDDAALAAEGADARERGGVVIVGLDVDADEVGTGFREGLEVALRLGEHQVRVEKEFDAGTAKGGKGLGAEGEIGDEAAVHDVAVEPGEAEVGDGARARSEVGVVAGEKGGG